VPVSGTEQSGVSGAKSEGQRAKGKGQRAKGKDLLLFALCSLDSEREWLRNEELFKLQIRWQSGAAAQGRTL
jgi:hypothetical protein